MTPKEYITIEGAKSHNLKSINLSIPRGEFVVVTGLSGSGKSSLAFDTIYAEGQRRYMDTLSAYAKHFMGNLEKPEVESISGLSPIIAIEQKTTGNNPRSTVGTITEIYDFLRLLYARAATAYSEDGKRELVKYNDDQILDLIMTKYDGKKCLLLAPLVRGRKGNYKDLFMKMAKRGYNEVRVDGKIVKIEQMDEIDRYKNHFIELVVDKLKPKIGDEKRIRNSIVTALGYGKGSIAIMDYNSEEINYFSKHLVDPDTGMSISEPAPHSFSFNSPQGYCTHCKGLGKIVDVNIDTIVPDKSISIADGGIVPLGKVRETKKFEIIRSIARKYDFSLYDPIAMIPDEVISLIIFGSDELFRIGQGVSSQMVSFPGIVKDIDEKVVCPVCNGTRLNKYTNCFKIDDKTISEVSSMEISELHSWFNTLSPKLNNKQKLIAEDIIKELVERTGFLLDVGLDYLSLNRPTGTLSGGESQRIRLATQIGSKLVNVLYILDEPSIGLHQKDNKKLINSLKNLRNEGNSVMVVEHDNETMLSSDWLIDIGPGAGINGGEVCFNGPVELALNKSINTDNEQNILNNANENVLSNEVENKLIKKFGEDTLKHCIVKDSITIDYLQGKEKIEIPKSRRTGNGKILSLIGAKGNNLKDVDIDFPLGMLIGISGLSGSGKSSLINDTLMPILKNKLHNAKQKPLEYKEIKGIKNIDKLIEIDQSPIGRTPRSNPATFTGVFNDIRKLFEATPDAKVRNYKAGRFSFNVPGGRCEACKGAGIKVIEMNFLPPVNVVCEECGGKRYKEDTLAVKYKDKNINDVLEMSINQAASFFEHIPKIARKLDALQKVGLGYIHLGQSAVTLSGGESQRMKLASELAKKNTGNTLYLLDEPTTGLHSEDIKILLKVLHSLVEQGNTVIVIEHNLDILKSVDYIFDLGPEGGNKGGYIVAQGTPEDLCNNPHSVTGPYLKEILE